MAATRAAYDATAATYVDFAGTEITDAIEATLDRSLLEDFAASFVERGRIADLGCGPGRVAAFLADRGVDVVGIDLSLRLLQLGRRAHPRIPVAVGSLSALPLADGSVDGVVCWYSIIHSAPDQLDAVFAEIARVLPVRGSLLVAFQAGAGERVHRTDVQGTPVSLTNYRHDLDDVVRRLQTAGFEVQSCIVRAPELAHESTPQAFISSTSE